MVQVPIGYRIRAARKDLKLTQAAVAKEAGISASYLNLIEANKREIGGALLKRIAGVLGISADLLSGRMERRLIAELAEAAAEPLVQHLELSPESASELVGRNPGWAGALLTFQRAWRTQAELANALSDRLNQDPVFGEAVHQMLTHVTSIRSAAEILDDVPDIDEQQRARFSEIISSESRRMSATAQTLAGLFDQTGNKALTITPADEVDDFLIKHNNWFPRLETAAAAIRDRIGIEGVADEGTLEGYLRAKTGIEIVRNAAADLAPGRYRNQMAFDGAANRITFLPAATRPTRRFQIARQIAQAEIADTVAAYLDDPALTSDTARTRVHRVLCSYVAGAIIFPYAEFLEAAEACRYDIEALRQRYDASIEQVCHRLVTLRDPERPGVPFAFLRTDPAGHITKRFPLPRLPLLRHGHACPLWAAFTAFQTPNRIVRQVAEYPDGSRYLLVAQAVARHPGSIGEPPFLHSIMLICELAQADRTVYADGLDLSSDRAVTPIGPCCRMCARTDCSYRGEDPIVDIDAAP